MNFITAAWLAVRGAHALARTTRGLWLLLAALCVVGDSAYSLRIVCNQDETAAEGTQQQDFYDELLRIEGLVERKKWTAVRKDIVRLLKKHAEAPYVIPYLAELQASAAEAEFLKGYKPPKLEALVDGELLSYKESNHKIELRYETEESVDFVETAFNELHTGFLHPLQFSDKWSITIEGTPKFIHNWNYSIEYGGTLAHPDRLGVEVEFGSGVQGAPFNVNHRLYRWKTVLDRPEVTDAAPKPLKNLAEPITATITVSKGKVQVKYAGKEVFKSELDFPGRPRFALIARTKFPYPQVATVTLSGSTTGEWVRSLLDKERTKDQENFNAAWKTPAVFKKWRVEDEGHTPRLDLEELLAVGLYDLSLDVQDHRTLVAGIRESLRSGPEEAAESEEKIREAEKSGLPAPAIDVLMLEFMVAVGDYRGAYHRAQEMKPKDELSNEHAVLLSELASRFASASAQLEIVEEFLELHPGEPTLLLNKCRALMLLGRREDAQTAVRSALSEWPYDSSLAQMERSCRKSASGPAWSNRYTYEGEHFVVISDVSKPVARAAGGVLDQAWSQCEPFLGALKEVNSEPTDASPMPKPRVHVFGSRASYDHYLNQTTPVRPRIPNGIYDPATQISAVWNPGKRLGEEWALYRVALQRYLHEKVGHRVPMWIREGAAEVFASCLVSKSKLSTPPTIAEYMGELDSLESLPDIDRLVQSTDEEYLASEEPNLQISWLYFSLAGVTVSERVPLMIEALAAMARGDGNTFAQRNLRRSDVLEELAAVMKRQFARFRIGLVFAILKDG